MWPERASRARSGLTPTPTAILHTIATAALILNGTNRQPPITTYDRSTL